MFKSAIGDDAISNDDLDDLLCKCFTTSNETIKWDLSFFNDFFGKLLWYKSNKTLRSLF